MVTKSVVAWNIRHGGGNGDRRARVVETLQAFDADVLVITEFRLNAAGEDIAGALRMAGYRLSHPATEPRQNTVLVASREPIRWAATLTDVVPDPRHLWAVDLGWAQLCAVYMPLNYAKLPYWDAILRAVAVIGPALVIGDFNTGDNALDKMDGATPFIGADYIRRVADAGLVDLWRSRNLSKREFTWFSNRGNGFRLDHAFARPEFSAQVVDCRYIHEPRLSGTSDHSALAVHVGT